MALTMTQPHTYSRRILLAVTGLSPQIVTETLYALSVMRQPAFMPTEIYVVTTSEGAERVRLSLLSDDPGWLAQLCHDYQLPPIAFDRTHIEVLQDAQGQPLTDIRAPADNSRMADLITERVRALTLDSESALHVSIAGGRKTMGYYAGYALSLFGRPQDRLSHVLVSEPFESSWQFFYPTPYSRVITTRDDKLIDTAEAQVNLAEIPFVRLRDGVPERLLKGRAGFAETIEAAQRAQQFPELVLDLDEQLIYAGGEIFNMPPAPLALYSLLARRSLANQPAVRWDSEAVAVEYLAEYGRIVGIESGEYERAQATLAAGMTAEDFDYRKSRTNKIIQDALGLPLAKTYQIHGDGGKPRTHYALRLPAAAIDYASLG